MDIAERLRASPMPFAALLGIELVEATADLIVARMTVRADLCTAGERVHGGALMAFVDTLGAMGTIANLPPGAGTTTIESKTNFLGAAAAGTTLIGRSTPAHRGRRTQVWQTRVESEDGRLLALTTQTQLVL
jgi:1,4-dihydroxy-2-naphthoyl-CoA hydrolase